MHWYVLEQTRHAPKYLQHHTAHQHHQQSYQIALHPLLPCSPAAPLKDVVLHNT